MEAGLAEDTNLYYMALVERGTGKCSMAHAGSWREGHKEGTFVGLTQRRL